MKAKLDICHPGFTTSCINSNFERIEQFLDYYPLKREVSYYGEPNEMRTPLEMGGSRIRNVTIGDIVTLKDLPSINFGEGLQVSQSVLEVVYKSPSNLRVSQSVIEVLLNSYSEMRVTQSVIEVLHLGV